MKLKIIIEKRIASQRRRKKDKEGEIERQKDRRLEIINIEEDKEIEAQKIQRGANRKKEIIERKRDREKESENKRERIRE